MSAGWSGLKFRPGLPGTRCCHVRNLESGCVRGVVPPYPAEGDYEEHGRLHIRMKWPPAYKCARRRVFRSNGIGQRAGLKQDSASKFPRNWRRDDAIHEFVEKALRCGSDEVSLLHDAAKILPQRGRAIAEERKVTVATHDTEAIGVQAQKHFGTGCLTRLHGMEV